MPKSQATSHLDIRPFRSSDAPDIAALTIAAIKNTDVRDYSPTQISAWAARVGTPEKIVVRCRDGRQVLVAADAEDKPIAFVDLDPNGHLVFLYCHPLTYRDRRCVKTVRPNRILGKIVRYSAYFL